MSDVVENVAVAEVKEKKTRVRRPKVEVDNEAFTAVWNEIVGAGGRSSDVDTRYGWVAGTALAHAAKLRKAGVSLAAGVRGRRKGDTGTSRVSNSDVVDFVGG